MSGDSERRKLEDLSVPEKIRLVQDLWDDIARTPSQVEVTEEQVREAERRLLDHKRNPKECSTWEDVRRRLERAR